MKKLSVLLICCLVSIASFSQNKEALNKFDDIKFYGIDFSIAKVFGAKETPSEFKVAFDRINQLFITESKKYNIAKYFKKNVLTNSLNEVETLNNAIKSNDLITQSENYKITKDELVKHIKALPIKSEEGVGLIFVAELLNKSVHKATYQIVFFNLSTKEIIDNWEVTGKAKGFSLRNYWAGSIYDVIKHVKY